MKIDVTTLRPLALVLLTLLPTACGGGGGEDDGSAALQPDARVVFPPASSLTDAPLVFVRGTATRPELIAGLRVHGVPAFSDDGFATWSTTVPLAVGTTTLKVDLDTTSGERLEAVDSITVDREGGLLGEAVDMAFSEDGLQGPEAWYLDTHQLLSQNLHSSEVQVVSGPERGLGPELGNPRNITVSPSGERVYVLRRPQGEFSGNSILEIDPVTGDRTELSGPNVGDGPLLEGASDLEYLEDRAPDGEDQLLVSFWNEPGLMFIDLSTGERTFEPLLTDVLSGAEKLAVFNDPGVTQPRYVAVALYAEVFVVDLVTASCVEVGSDEVGDGPLWGDPDDLSFTDRGEILVLDRDDVYQVDFLTEGYPRELRSEEVRFDGVSSRIGCIAIDSLDAYGFDLIAVMDEQLGMVARLDRGSVEWTPMLAPRVGSGIALSFANDLVRLEEGVLVAVPYPGHLVHVDGETGARSPAEAWHDFEHEPLATCVDEENGTAFFFEDLDGYIYMLDLESGETTAISGSQLGEGDSLGNVIDLEYDEQQQCLLALSQFGLFNVAVLEVDIPTGDRRILSGSGVGEGPGLSFPTDLTFDPDGQRLFVLSVFGFTDIVFVLEVDLTTGEREVLSGGDTGAGVELGSYSGMDYCPIREKLLLLNGGGALVLVDSWTGYRDQVSADDFLGTPPQWPRRLQWDGDLEIVYTVDSSQIKLMAYDLVGHQWMTVSR